MITVRASKHPLGDDWVEAEVEDGQTIREIVGPATVHVWINGLEVPAELLAHTRPKAGTTLIVRPVPQGDNLGRTLAQIAVVTAAVVAAAYGLPYLSAGIAMAGPLATNLEMPQ